MPEQPPKPTQSLPELDINRVLTLSDGVFAIAMTLLVLEIRLPALPANPGEAELARALLGLLPKCVSYVVSFLVISLLWLSHHRTLTVVRRVDSRFTWINILFLMLVSFLPFPTAVIGSYGNTSVATAFYAAVMSLTTAMDAWLLHYATAGHRLVDPGLSPEAIRFHRIRLWVPSLLFLASIGLALYRPAWTQYSWTLVAFSNPLTRRILRAPTAAA